jgi:hypothetical protein
LKTWFYGIHLFTQTKNGISVMDLKRQLGIGCYVAWRVKHKLMQISKEQYDRRPLSGIIQMDDPYWDGKNRGGKRGRDDPGKTSYVVAVQTNEVGHTIVMRLTKLKSFCEEEITQWAQRHLEATSLVVSDALQWFRSSWL